MIREPAVAGTFYSGDRESLKGQIEECFLHSLGPGKIPNPSSKREGKILGLISPHAGYVYSGPVAAWGFYEVIQDEIPDTVVILGPNHRGFGAPIALTSEEEWKTPLGKVSIDTSLANDLLKIASSVVQEDNQAHRREHSLEVQIPFLQYAYGKAFKILPICMSDQSGESSRELGEALAKIVKERNILIIASTDLTHYQPQRTVEREDKTIIEAILSLDYRNLGKLTSKYYFSMCGPGPVMSMLVATSLMGAKKVRLLKHATSGDITGDYSAVVGYASMVVEK
ncbi:AmmeMemoRadiSam system protein B [Candidatus Aerophobetes bacterium]|nr:AmmeMemoRadiSam system protein B [Candidatus Aerophobetes bacterium]